MAVQEGIEARGLVREFKDDGIDLIGLYMLAVLMNIAFLLWACGVAMRFQSVQAGPIMQTPVFLSGRTWSYVLGAGCLGFAGWAFARTGRLADMLGSDLATARAMAVRDLGSGIALVASRDPRPAMVARVLYDVSDAALFGRGRPKVAISALGFAALGLAGLRAR